MNIGEILLNLWEKSGFASATWQNYVMLLIGCVLLFITNFFSRKVRGYGLW